VGAARHGQLLIRTYVETNALVHRLAERLRERRSEPVAQVVVEELWLAVIDGSLESGERLPTPRQLAIALGVSPRSIDRAYDELERRGVTASHAGAGTFVSLESTSESDRARHQQFAALCRETVERTTALGFDIEDLLDALAEFRTAARDDRSREPPS
jgi:GntR family transcriptional regulator